MYTVIENARIVVALLKKHNICQIVLSPGGSNIPIVQAVQQDPFFKCYSVVDERSAMYFAIGLYLKTGEVVATSCTSANATRNYIPGLTEAFYKRVPILAITMSKHPMYFSQEYMQCPIQTSLPVDCIKKSYSLPRITDENNRTMCVRLANEAILELTHHGYGPVQLNIEELDSETWSFDKNACLPDVRVIKRFNKVESVSELVGKRVLILIGEHRPFSEDIVQAIETFCEAHNVFVYSNHISNFHGKYAFNANLLVAGMSQEIFNETIMPDVLISIGGITGDYPIYNRLFSMAEGRFEHWRVADDGNVIDTYNQLTRVYECDTKTFFESWVRTTSSHNYYEKWIDLEKSLTRNVHLPFSNFYAAQKLHDKIPANSYMNFAILNSLRSWLYFPIDTSIKCFSNVASFGIDGCMSTFFGESVVTDDLCFLIIGDLAFYYDMNAIGIRHIKNNVRILLVNNNGGVEFKLGDLQFKTDVGSFIAANDHFKNAAGWAKTQGFKYIQAKNKEEFDVHIDEFISAGQEPIIFEIFTNAEDEKKAGFIMVDSNRNETTAEAAKGQLKNTVKSIIGDKYSTKLKVLLGKK